MVAAITATEGGCDVYNNLVLSAKTQTTPLSRGLCSPAPPLADLGGGLRAFSFWRYTRCMLRLFDRAFWRFLFGFLLILAVSFSLLTLLGAFRETREQVAVFFYSLTHREAGGAR